MGSPVRRLTVYVDDGCRTCRWAAARARSRDGEGRLRMASLTEGERRFARADLLRELHAVDETGGVHRGYDAVVAVAYALPRVRRLAPLLGRGVPRRIGRWAYRSVAARRRRDT